MEDHREAYFFWKKLGLTDCTCVHVDAHLDTCEFPLPGTGGLSRPEVNCGNYLLYAIADGLVHTLVWVLPPHLAGDDLLGYVRREVAAWLHPTLAEHTSWQARDGRVEGRLRGCRFLVCPSDRLPRLAPPILLDVDVDYFLGPQDEVWQSPEQLASDLAPLEVSALTVAYSVEGGYTPVELRWLGPETMERFGASSSPDDFTLAPLDAACFHLQRKRYEACLEALEACEDRRAAHYLRAFVRFSQDRHEEALAGWTALLAEPHDDPTRRHLLEMQGLSQRALGRASEAVESLQEAVRLANGDVGLCLELARAQVEAGRPEDAARSYRRGIGLKPELMIALQAQLELVRLYQKLGQPALARAQRQRLLSHRLPPALQLQALGLGLKQC